MMLAPALAELVITEHAVSTYRVRTGCQGERWESRQALEAALTSKRARWTELNGLPVCLLPDIAVGKQGHIKRDLAAVFNQAGEVASVVNWEMVRRAMAREPLPEPPSRTFVHDKRPRLNDGWVAKAL